MNPQVDVFFSKAQQWQKEMAQLRELVLDCGLEEELKWGVPCYTHKNKNILIIHGFKEYCALNFFKGALLKDANGILVQQTENSQATRQIRFTDCISIVEMEPTLKAYIYEAIEVEKAGLQIDYKEAQEFELPEELQHQFEDNPALKRAFYALTPGRQKGYLLYFSAAKQPATRKTRIEKYTQRILNGKGIHDCVCGLSKKMPNCDGSHNLSRSA